MALIRYPGSKEKLADEIWAYFPDEFRRELWMATGEFEYREPFFGAGAVGFRVLSRFHHWQSVWINDVDPGMFSLWSAIRNHHEELMELISRFVPAPELFYQFKEEDGRTDLGIVEQGFRKLALHRMSYSGLGFMAGGPLGGRNQSSEYNVDCRWNPEKMKADIARLKRILRKFRNIKITYGDFAPLIEDGNDNAFIYCDPPYYEKGGQLYKYCMNQFDHERLAVMLRQRQRWWVLSYDDHPEIRRLYEWANIKPVYITYTTARARNGARPKNKEIVIFPKS